MRSIIVAKVVIFDSANKMLALRRSETDDRRPLQWDVPGGWVEEGEDIESSLVREVEEEAGLKISESDLNLVFTQHAIKKPKDEELNINWLYFVARIKSGEVVLSEEHDKFTCMTFEEALKEFEYPLQLEVIKHIHENDLLPGLD